MFGNSPIYDKVYVLCGILLMRLFLKRFIAMRLFFYFLRFCPHALLLMSSSYRKIVTKNKVGRKDSHPLSLTKLIGDFFDNGHHAVNCSVSFSFFNFYCFQGLERLENSQNDRTARTTGPGKTG